VTQNIGLKPNAEQVRTWEQIQLQKIEDGKKAAKEWKPTQKLGQFHVEYVGRTIEGYHSVLADAQALYDIETSCAELKEKRNHWCKIKHLAKPLDEILQRTAKNAAAYGAKKGHRYSRPPYGKELPKCYHRYPCSAYANKRQNQIVVNFRCNSEFNGRLRDKEKGEDRRCSFRLSEKEWIAIQKKEQEAQENMSIALALEGEEVVGNMLQMERQQKEQEITENMSIAMELEEEDAVGSALGVGVHAVASAAV
jgi:hypothetical protein